MTTQTARSAIQGMHGLVPVSAENVATPIDRSSMLLWSIFLSCHRRQAR
jgi:hypothetical protein